MPCLSEIFQRCVYALNLQVNSDVNDVYTVYKNVYSNTCTGQNLQCNFFIRLTCYKWTVCKRLVHLRNNCAFMLVIKCTLGKCLWTNVSEEIISSELVGIAITESGMLSGSGLSPMQKYTDLHINSYSYKAAHISVNEPVRHIPVCTYCIFTSLHLLLHTYYLPHTCMNQSANTSLQSQPTQTSQHIHVPYINK